MYRLLAEARQKTDNPAVQQRLDDLTLYARYVELFFDYSNAEGDERQQNFEQMIRHVYRMRETMMVHAKALYRDVAARDKKVEIPAAAAWSVPEERNPWKSSEPFPREGLELMVRDGIAQRKLRDFEPADFSGNLVPSSSLELKDASPGDFGLYNRGTRNYYTWVADPGQPIRLTLEGGRVYQDRGNVRVSLHAAGELDLFPQAIQEVPPDGKEHTIELKAPHRGLFAITISDGGAGTVARWPAGQPMTLLSSPDQPADFHGRWSLYFYVPKGTQTVGGYSSGPGTLLDSQGRAVHTFDKKPGFFSVPVEASEQGKLWKFERCSGQRLLMTVPPCLARSAEELLLPAEVVKRDAATR
jgi:hypothetical protein